jgi:hypothetical protein
VDAHQQINGSNTTTKLSASVLWCPQIDVSRLFYSSYLHLFSICVSMKCAGWFIGCLATNDKTTHIHNDMTTRHRETWNSEDSQQEMQKWIQAASNGSNLDPVVRGTQETLSENMWFFLDNIAERCVRYNAALKNASAVNPNNALSLEELKQATNIDEAPFLKIRIRRFVHVEQKPAENEEAEVKKEVTEAEKGEESKAEDETPRVQSGEAVPEKKATPKDNEESQAVEEDDDDDDDEETYDAVDEIPVVFPKNGGLVDEMKRLKLAGTELVTVFEGICDWLQLSIPDIMIDDNDSVDVMRSVLEATSAHSEAVGSTVTFLREYLEDRADMEVETLKFPHSGSLRRQMLINDLDAWSEVERGWRTLVRCSLIIHTLLAKNMRKLLNPRNSSRSSTIYQ